MSVVLDIQQKKQLHRIKLSSEACPALPYFSTLSHNRQDFSEKKVLEHIMYVLIFSTTFPEIFFILRRIQRDMTINVRSSSCKIPVILVRFLKKA